jgi:hypothetical protein
VLSLSHGYWCTDFLVVQRAMAANSMNAARRTPLITAVPKMLFPFLVILPGMIALVLTSTHTGGALYGHEEQDARTDAAWHVDYAKEDWSNATGLDAPEQYAKFRDALAHFGQPIAFSICEWGHRPRKAILLDPEATRRSDRSRST